VSKQGWGAVDIVARYDVLRVLEDGEEHSSRQIAEQIHRRPSSTHQMLMALAEDNLVSMRRVDRFRGGIVTMWRRTSVPLPEYFTSTARHIRHVPEEVVSTLTAQALSHAMHSDGVPLRITPSRVHKLK
jgi:transcription initiation factor IIE alpha subunit